MFSALNEKALLVKPDKRKKASRLRPGGKFTAAYTDKLKDRCGIEARKGDR